MGKYDKGYETFQGKIYRKSTRGGKRTTYLNPKGSRKGKWVPVGKAGGNWLSPASWISFKGKKKSVSRWDKKKRGWVWDFFVKK